MTDLFSKFDPLIEQREAPCSNRAHRPVQPGHGAGRKPDRRDLQRQAHDPARHLQLHGHDLRPRRRRRGQAGARRIRLGHHRQPRPQRHLCRPQGGEEALKDFYAMDHAMVFSTGYQANLGIISTIAGKDDYIVLDIDSHASIYDGCALGNAQIVPFRHNDVEALEKRLKRIPEGRRQAGRARRRLFDARRHRAAQGNGRGVEGRGRDGAGRRGAFDGLHRRAWPRRRRGAGRDRRRRLHHRHLLQVGRHGRRLLRLQPSQVRDPAAGLPALCVHRLAAAVGGRDRRDLDPQADARADKRAHLVGKFKRSTPA
jgi:hypothetical protein